MKKLVTIILFFSTLNALRHHVVIPASYNPYSIVIAMPALAKACADSSTGIYFTKDQFEKDELQLKSSYSILEKEPILWSDFAYEANTQIKIKISKKIAKTFELGSIYGFKKDGIKFMFVKSLNKYLAVLYENRRICFFVGDNNVYFYKAGTRKQVFFLYTENTDSSLKKFNKLNISNDFSKDLNLEKKLLYLFGKMEREKSYFPYKDFFKWQKIIENYMKEDSG